MSVDLWPAFTLVDAYTIWVHAGMHERAHDEWVAINAWCRQHGLEPADMPANQVIFRDFKRCRVEYDEFVLIGGARVHDAREESGVQVQRTFRQGETPPLPFPDVILAHLDRKEPA